jgi:hypothetical protein
VWLEGIPHGPVLEALTQCFSTGGRGIEWTGQQDVKDIVLCFLSVKFIAFASMKTIVFVIKYWHYMRQ